MALSLKQLTCACVYLAEAAGTAIAEIMQKGFAVKSKAPEDYQTEADRTAESMIVGGLKNQWPTLKVVGEEACEDGAAPPVPDLSVVPTLNHLEWKGQDVLVNADDVCVWVDPLDGTKEFVIGNKGAVTVLVGVAEKGVPVAGVVHRPFAENGISRTVWSAPNQGVRGILTPGKVDAAESESQQSTQSGVVTPTVVVSASRPTKQIESSIEALNPVNVIRAGGCGNKILMVLEGAAHAMIMPTSGMKKWDTCAPAAVLRTAGGSLSDGNGSDLVYVDDGQYMHDGVVASLGIEHGDLVAAVRSARLEHGVKGIPSASL